MGQFTIIALLCICLSLSLNTSRARQEIPSQPEQGKHLSLSPSTIRAALLFGPCKNPGFFYVFEFSDVTPAGWVNAGQELLIPRMPRRLKMSEEVAVVVVKGHATEDFKPQKNQKEDNSGNQIQREDKIMKQEYRAKKGADTSHFFTMDYAPVHRRRPIHNKSLPVGP
ncbi:hypothetical protein CDL15_Pgr009511 [Punica granatum]|uniref:Uncharacterized protein n=1 Tax=Punica granatum TaxID=22663 RepID=A0A218WSL7_PUNGR|nr:hypothetical protein CDL15_Pgr009511 [Punica granatum]